MLKAHKYRLYPNKEQKAYFAKSFGCVRFIYNQMLANRIKLYEKYKDNKEKLKENKPKTYTSFKKDYEFLKEVDNLALANAQMDLNNAYKKFFKEGAKFPKFKSKHRSKKSYKTNKIKESSNLKKSSYLPLYYKILLVVYTIKCDVHVDELRVNRSLLF